MFCYKIFCEYVVEAIYLLNLVFNNCDLFIGVQWTWDKESKSDFVEIINDNMDVRFHRNYSNGTAVVRCTEPMTNHQYYWEVKMTYPVYGTDIVSTVIF